MDHSQHIMANHGERAVNKHAGHVTEDFLQKFWLVSLLTAIISLIPALPANTSLILILASVIFFYGGGVFLVGAYRELAAKLPGMMTLVSLAITTSYLFSVYSLLSGLGGGLIFEFSTLIAVMLLGHWLEMKAVSTTEDALKELSKLLPDTAEVIRNGKVITVAVSELTLDDIVVIRPGSRLPADGVITEGQSDLNESLITGESRPITKKTGDEVIAGSINGDGSLRVKLTKIGEATFLSSIMRLVAEAQYSKSRLQLLSDRAAFYLTIIAVISGGITFSAWFLSGAGMFASVERLVAVLVIACPHALGLAIPLVASSSTSMAAKNGILIRKRLSLESTRTIDTILFDKTGTLTEAKFKVVSFSSDESLVLAASVDAHSEHPIALALVEEAKRRGLSLVVANDFRRVPGMGAQAMIDDRKIFVGHQGGDEIVVLADGQPVGQLQVADAVRTESKEAVEELKSMGIRVAMITGDSQDIARRVAEELGLDEYFARVSPEGKVAKVRELQAGGRKVAMVGDGINDAPAMAQSDLGIAIGAGTNVAIESAGIILVRNDPRDIVKVIKLSKLTYNKMVQNLFWATGYNVIAMPLAGGALASYGIILQPAIAAALMSISTVIVAVNAIMLRGQKINS